MDDPNVLERMRADWNERAAEDANYYVAFGRREQEEAEFFATAEQTVRGLEVDLGRLRERDAALEIGCGPGRLMRPLSRHFKELHGVDISDAMIQLARERLRDTPNAFPHHSSGADLKLFPDGKFDYVYSYAVFQHIPSAGVVFQYLREARRVLKIGGILRCQINGLPPTKQYDTWCGVCLTPEEISRFALDNDFQLLGLELIHTQYMWVTCRKRPSGWERSLAGRKPEACALIRSLSNALTGDAAAPASGPTAGLSLWTRDLPDECDLNHMAVHVDGVPGRLEYIGPPANDRVQQMNVRLPEGVRTGIVPVELFWLGQPICPPAWVRIIPPGPAVARLTDITDGVNLLLNRRTATGSIKVHMVEVPNAADFRAAVDGVPVHDTDSFCADPIQRRFEFNFRLPEGVGRGAHQLQIGMGKHNFPPVTIEVM